MSKCCRGATFRSTATFSLNLVPPQRLTRSRRAERGRGVGRERTRHAQRFPRPARPDPSSLRFLCSSSCSSSQDEPTPLSWSSSPSNLSDTQGGEGKDGFSFISIVFFPYDLYNDLSNIFLLYDIISDISSLILICKSARCRNNNVDMQKLGNKIPISEICVQWIIS